METVFKKKITEMKMKEKRKEESRIIKSMWNEKKYILKKEKNKRKWKKKRINLSNKI